MHGEELKPQVIRGAERDASPNRPARVPEPSEEKRARLSPWRLGGLSSRELGRRVWKSVDDDDVFGRAAQLAYYFFLALFPALIFLTALLGLLAGPGTRLHDSLLGYIATALPVSAYELVRKTIDETTKASGGGKIGFGLLATLWSATSGMTALQDTLNAVYNVHEARPIWKRYALAMTLTVVSSILTVLALLVILYGNTVVNFLATQIGLSFLATWTWKIVQWPIALLFLAMVFSVTYYYAPDVDQRHWQWLTPGALVGIVTWVAASAALRRYLHFFNTYSATYGSLGAVIILLTWFYVTGIMLLLGAEVNAEIENAAAKQGLPDAKHKGQKVPAAPADELQSA